MDPEEPRPIARRRREPRQRAAHDLVAAPLDALVAILARLTQMESRVVRVEAAIESGRGARARIENERSDERGGAIAGAAQDVRQVRDARGERRAEVADVMERRIGAGENRRVRDRRDRGLRVRAREDDRLAREPVERGCQPARGSQEAHAIGARRVERDQKDVGLRRVDTTPVDGRQTQNERRDDADRKPSTHKKGTEPRPRPPILIPTPEYRPNP